ncbi:MAG: MBL fold metallo-hydrolase [Desulfobacteraceae bacterium]|nr:MBL fold metallo-hydrolase [Desulfobacteraceae bacterium]
MKDHYIPEDAFPVQLAENLYMLGNYFFNLFLIRGEKKTALFETGVSATVDTVISQLEKLNARPDFIIPSHPHSDHITGLPGLVQRFPNAEIITAQGALEFVSHPKAGPILVKEDQFINQGLEKFGIQPGRPSLETIPDIKNSMVVSTSTCLDLGGTTLELIKVEGHSPGNLIARIVQDNILFVSDSLGFHFPGRHFIPLFFTGLASYLSTMDRIRSFSPAIVCPAHQGPVKGKAAAPVIEKALADTRKIITRITKTKLSDPDLIQNLFEYSYKDEFTLYTETNIKNCMHLLVKRVRQT